MREGETTFFFARDAVYQSMDDLSERLSQDVPDRAATANGGIGLLPDPWTCDVPHWFGIPRVGIDVAWAPFLTAEALGQSEPKITLDPMTFRVLEEI